VRIKIRGEVQSIIDVWKEGYTAAIIFTTDEREVWLAIDWILMSGILSLILKTDL
jgi:hypothetical protein